MTLEATPRGRGLSARDVRPLRLYRIFCRLRRRPGAFRALTAARRALPEETSHYLMTTGPDVREAIVAERPAVAAGLTARAARTVSSMSENGLFFPLGAAFGTTTQASLGPVDRHLSGLDSRRNSPAPGGLFVPLTSSRGTLIDAEEGP
jgi:hypothetical protein